MRIGLHLVEIGPDEPGSSPAELAYAEGRRRAQEHLAARRAARVALAKALGLPESDPRLTSTVEVTRAEEGRPALRLGPELQALVDALGCAPPLLSLTHTERYAMAQVLLPPKTDFGE